MICYVLTDSDSTVTDLKSLVARFLKMSGEIFWNRSKTIENSINLWNFCALVWDND